MASGLDPRQDLLGARMEFVSGGIPRAVSIRIVQTFDLDLAVAVVEPIAVPSGNVVLARKEPWGVATGVAVVA